MYVEEEKEKNMGPFAYFLGLLLLSSYRHLCNDDYLGLNKTVSLFNGAVVVQCSANTYKIHSAGLLEEYSTHYLSYDPYNDGMSPKLRVATKETATRFVYENERLYTLDKTTVSTNTSSIGVFMVDRPELATSIKYESGYLISPVTFSCLGLNPSMPETLTSETASGSPTLYLGDCKTKVIDSSSSNLDLQQQQQQQQQGSLNESQMARLEAQDTVRKLQQWVMERDLDFRTLKVTIVNGSLLNPVIPVRLIDSYDGLLHPAKLASDILRTYYAHVNNNDSEDLAKLEMPDFLAARIAFYEEFSKAGIEKENLNNLIDRYEHLHGYSKFAFDSTFNYRDQFDQVFTNDFCSYLGSVDEVEFFVNSSSGLVRPIATPREVHHMTKCFLQDISVVLTNPQSMIVHVTNWNPSVHLGLPVTGYRLEEVLVAAIPDRSRKLLLDEERSSIERGMFSRLQHVRQNQTIEQRSPVLNYRAVLVTDSTNSSLLDTDEMVVNRSRPLGDREFGEGYFYVGNLKPNTLHRVVAIFSDLRNPANLSRVYVDFETGNRTTIDISSQLLTETDTNQTLVCHPQLALDTCPMRAFTCGNRESYLSNYPRFSAAMQYEIDTLKMDEYVRSCCFLVSNRDNNNNNDDTSSAGSSSSTSTSPTISNSSCRSFLNGTNLTLIPTDPYRTIELLRAARLGRLEDEESRVHLELLRNYLATLDEASVSRYLSTHHQTISFFSDLNDRVNRLFNKYACDGKMLFRSPNVVDMFEDKLMESEFSKRHIRIATLPGHDYALTMGHCEFYPRADEHLTPMEHLDSCPAFFNAGSFVYMVSRPTHDSMQFDIEMNRDRFAQCNLTSTTPLRFPFPHRHRYSEFFSGNVLSNTNASYHHSHHHPNVADSVKLHVLSKGHVTHHYNFLCANVSSLSIGYAPGKIRVDRVVTMDNHTTPSTNDSFVRITVSSTRDHLLEYVAERNPTNVTLVSNLTNVSCDPHIHPQRLRYPSENADEKHGDGMALCHQVFVVNVTQRLTDIAAVLENLTTIEKQELMMMNLVFRDSNVPTVCEAIEVTVPVNLTEWFFPKDSSSVLATSSSSLSVNPVTSPIPTANRTSLKGFLRLRNNTYLSGSRRPRRSSLSLTKTAATTMGRRSNRADWQEECPENDPVRCSMLAHNPNLSDRARLVHLTRFDSSGNTSFSSRRSPGDMVDDKSDHDDTSEEETSSGGTIVTVFFLVICPMMIVFTLIGIHCRSRIAQR